MAERTVFQNRLNRHYDELKWLYCELYEGRMDMFEDLCRILGERFSGRPDTLKALDFLIPRRSKTTAAMPCQILPG